jgi:hypothetical protein
MHSGSIVRGLPIRFEHLPDIYLIYMIILSWLEQWTSSVHNHLRRFAIHGPVHPGCCVAGNMFLSLCVSCENLVLLDDLFRDLLCLLSVARWPPDWTGTSSRVVHSSSWPHLRSSPLVSEKLLKIAQHQYHNAVQSCRCCVNFCDRGDINDMVFVRVLIVNL